MTIALGIVAAGGMVIAADRQETAGFTKSNQGKVSAAWKAGRGCIVLSGAGDGPHIDALMQEFRDWFTASETPLTDGDIDTEIRRRHEAFYERYVLPFGPYAEHERPDYELIIAASLINHSRCLWTSSKLVVNQGQGFAAVGIGATTAKALLAKYYTPFMPIEIAVSLAAYVVYQIKQTVDGVGFDTDMFAVIKHAPFFVSEGEISGMETHFRSYETTERANLYYCLGANSSGDGFIPDPIFRGDERDLREKATRHFFEQLNAKRVEEWHPKSPRSE